MYKIRFILHFKYQIGLIYFQHNIKFIVTYFIFINSCVCPDSAMTKGLGQLSTAK